MNDLNYVEISKLIFESKKIISETYKNYFSEDKKQLAECLFLLNEAKLGWNSVQLFVIFSILNDDRVKKWIEENRPDLLNESVETKTSELFKHFYRIRTLEKSRRLIAEHPRVNDEGSVHYFDFVELTNEIQSFRIDDWKDKIHEWTDFYYTEAFTFLKNIFINDLLLDQN